MVKIKFFGYDLTLPVADPLIILLEYSFCWLQSSGVFANLSNDWHKNSPKFLCWFLSPVKHGPTRNSRTFLNTIFLSVCNVHCSKTLHLSQYLVLIFLQILLLFLDIITLVFSSNQCLFFTLFLFLYLLYLTVFLLESSQWNHLRSCMWMPLPPFLLQLSQPRWLDG